MFLSLSLGACLESQELYAIQIAISKNQIQDHLFLDTERTMLALDRYAEHLVAEIMKLRHAQIIINPITIAAEEIGTRILIRFEYAVDGSTKNMHLLPNETPLQAQETSERFVAAIMENLLRTIALKKERSK